MQPVTEIARTVGIDEKYIEQYGRYKAKIDLALLKDLAELKDYQSVQHFASKALEIEPGNAEAVYWLIAALMKIGSVQSAQAEYDRAKQMLPEPAFKELQEKLLVEQIYLK